MIKRLDLFCLLVLLCFSCSKDEGQKIDYKAIVPTKAIHQVNFVGQWMTEGKRELIVRNFVREYEFQNQEVHINLKFPEEIGFDRYSTESTYAFNSDLLKQPIPKWDIVLINDDMEGLANYMGDTEWAGKYLVDFSKYSAITENTIAEIDIEKVKKRWNGILPGPFLEGQYWALWTNKKVAEKIGIEVKQYGMTFDDYMSYLSAVEEYNKTNTDKIVAFQESIDWGSSFSIANQLYLSLFDDIDVLYKDEVTEKKLQAWSKTLQALEKMAALKPLNENWESALWSDNKANLLNEKCLFFANGSWMYNIWVEIDKELVLNCIPSEFPTFQKTKMYPGGFPIMWAVHKNTPNKKQAIDFLLGMNKPAMAEEWVRKTKCPTGIKGSLSEVNFGSDQFEAFSYELQKTYGKNMYKISENAKFVLGEKHTYEPIYFMEVITGELTAKQAMKKIRTSMGRYIR
jgi:hypothetical protein